MASKGSKLLRAGKSAKAKIKHPPFLRTTLPAGNVTPAPPLGPQLGQRAVQIAGFCKDFNEMTKDYKPNIPLRTDIHVNPDRSVKIVLSKPPVSYFLKNAAGCKKCAAQPGNEVAGKVSLKHIYEIAVIKSEDPVFENRSLEFICKQIIGQCHSLGIEVVKHLDPKDYAVFLEERKEIVQEQEEKLEEIRQAKLLRL